MKILQRLCRQWFRHWRRPTYRNWCADSEITAQRQRIHFS